jgi:predicted RNase H-like HicB family nuclease
MEGLDLANLLNSQRQTNKGRVNREVDLSAFPTIVGWSDAMDFHIEFDTEEDGRWIAEIPELPGVLAYGASKNEAQSKVEALALRVIADKIEREQSTTDHVLFAMA